MKILANRLTSLILVFTLTSVLAFSQDVGDEAPDFDLETLDGGRFILSDHLGNVVFIFLFGYDCPHCLGNGPNTQSGIYEVYKDSTDFVAVGVDTWDGNVAGVENFKSITGVEYTLCLMGSELESLYETTYDRIIVIDKEGIIRYKATANATTGVVKQASDVIKSYLGEGNGTMDMITGINDNIGRNVISLYPLPASDELEIRGLKHVNSNIQVRIMDMTGRLFGEYNYRNLSRENLSLPVNHLEDGLYILQIASPRLLVTQKFLVEK